MCFYQCKVNEIIDGFLGTWLDTDASLGYFYPGNKIKLSCNSFYSTFQLHLPLSLG